MKIRFYQCEKCGKVVISIQELSLGADWKELVANTTEAATEKHIPVVTVDGDTVKVVVGSVNHPMTVAHNIQWIAIQTQNGFEVRYLDSEGEPEATFALADGEKVVAVYAYCNLHGLWRA